MDGFDCEVAVVGGGIAGLAAAWALRDRDVLVLEAGGRCGGRIRSEAHGDYWLNLGAHVFGGAQTATGRLVAELGLEARDLRGALAAVSLDGKLVARGPIELFPLRLRMGLRERAALVRSGLKLRLAVRRYGAVARPRLGESDAERQQRMFAFMDDRSFSSFMGPLPANVDALYRCTLTRSSSEPEALSAGYGVGYFHLVWNRSDGLSRNVIGGPQRMTDTIAAALDGRVRTGARVVRVTPDATGVTLEVSEDDRTYTVRARTAVVATPAYATCAIVDGLPADTEAALAAIPYGPYVIAAFLTTEDGPSPWDDLYALATPKRAFSMLFNTANALRGEGPRRPGGAFMAYAAANAARALDGLTDDEVRARFDADLVDLFPALRGRIAETAILRLEHGLPSPFVGRSLIQDSLTRDLAPVFLAGDYLGSWHTETAVQTAAVAAAGARKVLG